MSIVESVPNAAGIFSPTNQEQLVSQMIRDNVIKEINDLDPIEVALKLGLAPSGLKVLISRPSWNLETAFRVADLLGFNVMAMVKDEA